MQTKTNERVIEIPETCWLSGSIDEQCIFCYDTIHYRYYGVSIIDCKPKPDFCKATEVIVKEREDE